MLASQARAPRLASIPDLSKRARQRLKWFDYYNSHGHNARLTCRYFGISPQTFYRWKRRYNPYHLESLENRSCRPKKLRQPTYSVELVTAVQWLREEHPRWDKDKLVVLLRREGYQCSISMVGRILRRLKDRGVLREPVRNHVSAHRQRIKRPHAIRKPKGYPVAELRGELLEWEHTYNTVRPHQSLNYLTPLEFLQCYNKNHGKEVMCH